MSKHIFLSVFFSFFISTSFSQPDDFYYYDYTYSDQIKTVNFHQLRKPISLPIVKLRGDSLRLSFDDLTGEISDFAYRIIHCDKNWNATRLMDLEYIRGFNDELIDDLAQSRTFSRQYTHYNLILPNEDLGWTKSGNYLLLVYDAITNDPIVTKRFVVYEEQLDVLYRFVNSRDVSQLETHHGVSLKLNNRDFPIGRPNQEISATILQNGVWQNALYNIVPELTRGDFIEFTLLNRMEFPGLKEFRFFDCRSLEQSGLEIFSVDITQDGVVFLLDIDKDRSNMRYNFEFDANGKYLVDKWDGLGGMTRNRSRNGVNISEIFNTAPDDIESFNSDFDDFRIEKSAFINSEAPQVENLDVTTFAEYVEVIFTLEETFEQEHDIYILGGFSDWQAYEENLMQYDPDKQAYIGKALFKQGFYDYMYGYQDENGKISLVDHEGNSFKTENNYTTIIYYTEFGAEYDRVIGYTSFNSNAR